MTQDPFAPRPGSTPGGYGSPPGPSADSPYGPQPGPYGAQPGPYGAPQGSAGPSDTSPYWPPPQQYGAPQGSGPQPGGPASGGPYGPPGPTSLEPKAWIALLCAVLAYTPTVPFIGAVAALLLARSARRDIRASGGRLTGLSLCTWAVVLSWVHLVFVGLFFVLFLVFVLAGLALPFGLSAV